MATFDDVLWNEDGNVGIFGEPTCSTNVILPSVCCTQSTESSNLCERFWKRQCESEVMYEVLKPSHPFRTVTSYPMDVIKEILAMMADWRAQAVSQLTAVTNNGRRRLLKNLCIPDYDKSSDDSQLYCDPTYPFKAGDSSSDSSMSPGSVSSLSTFSKQPLDRTRRKRKSLLIPRADQVRTKLLKRSKKMVQPESDFETSPEGRIRPTDDKESRRHNQPEYDSDERDSYGNDGDEEEEDQLTTIVRRQREAFSARAAAGRPSVRNAKPLSSDDCKLSGANLSTIARLTQSDAVLREWRTLARKVLCKLGRQWITGRRDRLILAKRAARDCSRILRQRAVLSQKLAKDAVVRAHRLTREIMANWRNSATSIANGLPPCTINGVTMPSDISLLRYTDLYPNSKAEAPPADGQVVESAAAARRRVEKAAAEQRRADLELLEARRQQRKLNFLITQTELYAHFMAKKLHSEAVPKGETSYVEESEDKEDIDAQDILNRLEDSNDEDVNGTGGISQCQDESQKGSTLLDQSEVSCETKRSNSNSIALAAREAANRLGIKPEDEYDVDLLKSQTLSKVKLAVDRERQKDVQYHDTHRLLSNDKRLEPENNLRLHAMGDSLLEAPNLFRGELKAYQLRGLNWLLGLFDQGINGILADEMGLGKTIQTIAFLGYLAERYNIWGPFLIVAPASTLHNWTQEFAKFLPEFKLVPYWGSPAERKVLRRFWHNNRSSKSNTTVTYDVDDTGDAKLTNETAYQTSLPGMKEAEMHVVVTSYQIVLQDAKFINKTAWSHIVLDEAHAIKSTASLRWRILLSFKCRNRLLLTGTPIQNTMQELWALLHFIMPTLFDSHDEFANWFSRDIESHATATAAANSTPTTANPCGSLATSRLDANQLSRLHLILKPFMLRRTKAEVEHEISSKTEILQYCPMSCRQRMLYSRLRNKIRFEDINTVIAAGGLMDGNVEGTVGASTTARLINLVMQLRKICNHPDLWERREVRFSCVSGAIHPVSPSSHTSCNLLAPGVDPVWDLPLLLADEGLIPQFSWNHVPIAIGAGNFGTVHFSHLSGMTAALVARLFFIFHPSHIHCDLWHDERTELEVESLDLQTKSRVADCPVGVVDRCFSFARLMALSPKELALAMVTAGVSMFYDERRMSLAEIAVLRRDLVLDSQKTAQPVVSNPHLLYVRPIFPVSAERMCLSRASVNHYLSGLQLWDYQHHTGLFLPSYSTMARELFHEFREARHLTMRLHTLFVPKVILQPLRFHIPIPYFPARQLSTLFPPVIYSKQSYVQCESMFQSWIPPCSLELVHLATRVSDSGKLAVLDELLDRLKPDGHRVLIYSQMTRMIDILEEFMIYRKHAYLRLDGTSRLCDRRDMVAQWQCNPRWFVFLLSTRAGGLGINLTAADTVIFYDSDWNPTVDQQAMDRAHRLGQTKPVTVYRLVCKNTVEERMMQRAEEKRAMQQIVIRSGENTAMDSTFRSGRTADQLTSSDMVSLLLYDEEVIKRLQIRRLQQSQRGRPVKHSAQSHPDTDDISAQSNTTAPIMEPCVDSTNSALSVGDRVNNYTSNTDENNLKRSGESIESLTDFGGVTKKPREYDSITNAAVECIDGENPLLYSQ